MDQVRRRTKELVYDEVLACKSEPRLQYVVHLCCGERWDDCRVKDWILTSLAFAGAGFNIRHLGSAGFASEASEHMRGCSVVLEYLAAMAAIGFWHRVTGASILPWPLTLTARVAMAMMQPVARQKKSGRMRSW